MFETNEGEIGSRTGRSSSSPNVSSTISEELRAKFDRLNEDDQDLDSLYGDGVTLISGIGPGGSGMGTLLVREDSVDNDTSTSNGISLPRRVVRSSSHNAQLTR